MRMMTGSMLLYVPYKSAAIIATRYDGIFSGSEELQQHYSGIHINRAGSVGRAPLYSQSHQELSWPFIDGQHGHKWPWPQIVGRRLLTV